MILREQQIAALQNSVREAFADSMVLRCLDLQPFLTAWASRSQLASLVESAIRTAKRYGFVQRGAVRTYVELTLIFGLAFESDPRYPWAKSVLAETQQLRADPIDIAIRLFRAAEGHLAAAEAEYFEYPLRVVSACIEGTPTRSPEQAVQHFFPQRLGMLSAATMGLLSEQAYALAAEYSLPAEGGASLLLVLLFCLGTVFFRNPLYSWILASTDRRHSPEQNLEQVRQRWLDTVKV